jgi:hypothetical protein
LLEDANSTFVDIVALQEGHVARVLAGPTGVASGNKN